MEIVVAHHNQRVRGLQVWRCRFRRHRQFFAERAGFFTDLQAGGSGVGFSVRERITLWGGIFYGLSGVVVDRRGYRSE